jgi:hypothetical protein
MWHACGPYTVEGFMKNKGPQARALFEEFVKLLESCGPVIAAPAKTRVAFMVRVRFAGVHRVSERTLVGGFGLPYPIDHNPRIRKIDFYPPSWYVHTIELHSLAEFDDELRGWLCESYHLMGEQKRLSRNR